MATHFTGQQCPGFLDLCLDKGMPRFPHQRLTAMFTNNGIQVTRTLYIIDNLTTRIARQDIDRVQHQHPIRPYDLAVCCDNTKPVTVTVKCQADISLICPDSSDKRLHILGLARVRMMIWKIPIDLAEQLGDFTTQTFQ